MSFWEELWDTLWSEFDPRDPTSIIVKVTVVGTAFFIAILLIQAALG